MAGRRRDAPAGSGTSARFRAAWELLEMAFPSIRISHLVVRMLRRNAMGS